MNQTIQFVRDHWTGIVACAVTAHALAHHIVDLTPSPQDNAILEKVDRFLQVFGFNSRK